jgi:nitric oxide synthase-interacting protein
MGSDSMKAFDACYLCLQTARDPLSCEEGHLSCKECVYENILSQKNEMIKQKKLKFMQEKKLEEEAKRLEVKNQELIEQNFKASQTSLLPESASKKLRLDKADQNKNAHSESARALALYSHGSEKEKPLSIEEKPTKSALPSFWIV